MSVPLMTPWTLRDGEVAEMDEDAKPDDADGGFELTLLEAVARVPANPVAASLAADPLEEHDQLPEAKRRRAKWCQMEEIHPNGSIHHTTLSPRNKQNCCHMHRGMASICYPPSPSVYRHSRNA